MTSTESAPGALCAFAVMAKAPRIGEVKTRLAPPLTAAQAAMLSRSFLKDIAGNFLAAAETAPIHGYVAYSPAGSEDLFRALLPPEIRLLPPRRSGLGYSLLHAAEDLLAAGYAAACLVNADSPTLPTAALIAAATALRACGDRVVLGPANDGGYYLIGMKRPHKRLFEEIDWSTERVFAQTLDRAAEIGLEATILPPWYDVDDAAALGQLRRELLGEGARGGAAAGGYRAPHTAAFLRRLAAEASDDRGRAAGAAR